MSVRLTNRKIGGAAERGFTLLEILAAFVIFALSYVTLLQIFSGGVRNAVLSQEYTEATLLAQSMIAELGIEEPLEPGSNSGEFDDKYRWELDVTPFENEGSLPDINYRVTMMYVALTVSWGEGERVNETTLETLRTVPTEL